jgi:hypothetical protein
MIYCQNCGKRNQDKDNFCINCGKSLVQKDLIKQKFHQKSKKKIYAIFATIIVLITIVIIIIFLLGSNNFVGTWKIIENTNNQSSVGETMTFHSDGRLTQSGSSDSATWKVENNKFCIFTPETDAPMCFDYEFSNGDNQLTLSMYSGIATWRIVLERI